MKPLEFAEANVRIGEKQPQYEPLPAHVWKDDLEGKVTFGLELDAAELAEINRTGRIWWTVLTYNTGFQPQHLSVTKPDLKTR